MNETHVTVAASSATVVMNNPGLATPQPLAGVPLVVSQSGTIKSAQGQVPTSASVQILFSNPA